MNEFTPAAKLLANLARPWDAAPIGVEISPTNSCNAKCPWCFHVSSEYKQRHSKEELRPHTLWHAVMDMYRSGVKAITWTGGGNPSMYSQINWIIYEASLVGLKQGMFTNAYMAIANPELLNWIRVTVTEKYTITKHVSTYAKATKVGVNFNLCAENESTWEVLCDEVTYPLVVEKL